MTNEKITVGLSTTAVYPSPVSKAFEVASRLGYDGVEIMVTQSQNSRTVHHLQKLEQQYETKILSIHAPNLLLTHFVWGRSHHNKMFKTIELAQELNVNTIVVHPPMRTQYRHARDFLENVAELEANSGLKVAVENMFPWRVKNKSLDVYSPSWDVIKENASNMTLDFSHAALSGFDSLQEVKQIGDRLAHIHLCDGRTANGNGDKVMDEHALPGEGDQPVAEVLQHLASSGWVGSIVAEVNTRQFKTPNGKLKALKKTLEFARTNLQTF